MGLNGLRPLLDPGQRFVNAAFYAIAISLGALGALLVVLCVRAFVKFARTRLWTELAWGSGIALAAGAMAIEAVVYVGVVSTPLLQAYIFFSAAIVGVLSLGATKVLRRPRLAYGYTVYTLVACAAVGVFSFLIPVGSEIVSAGIISGNPPLLLLVLSTLVTGPATILLLAASVIALRRSWRWQTLLMIGGALVLGAGGTLYIASFPVALYYAEFIGIVLLFLGLISLPQSSPVSASSPKPAGAG